MENIILSLRSRKIQDKTERSKGKVVFTFFFGKTFTRVGVRMESKFTLYGPVASLLHTLASIQLVYSEYLPVLQLIALILTV